MVVSSPPVDSRRSRAPWLTTWNLAVLLLLIATGAYFQTWVDLWPYWVDENATYTHGTFVALISVWLVWRARQTVNQIEAIPSAWTLPVIIILSAAWVLAEKANVFSIYIVLWPLLAFLALWVGLGLRVAYQFALPLSFLYFAMPVWDYLKPPLQAIAATMVGLFTNLFGLPATLNGTYITLPTETLFIADDCSGAHFLCIALAVGVLAGAIRGDTLRVRILILVLAGLLSMAFNWLRILLIILAYLHPGLKGAIETMEAHLTLGWWVFALDLLVFALILRFVPRAPHQIAGRWPPDQKAPTRSNGIAGVWMSILALVVLPAIAWALPRFDSYPTRMPDPELGLSASKTVIVSPDWRWRPHYPGTVWEGRFAIATAGGIVIEIYANRYNEQTHRSELISRESHLFNLENFAPESSGIIYLHDSDGQVVQVHSEILSQNAGASWQALYTYFVDQDPVASGRRVKLLTAGRSIYARVPAGVVAAATPCIDTCESRISDLENTFVRVLESYRKEFGE